MDGTGAMELTEEALLEAIRRVLSGAGPEVRVGVGDDAAVLAPTGGELVLTTDVMVEGIHFVRQRTGARDVGYKAIVVNVSDLAAMGASPRAAVCALVLPTRRGGRVGDGAVRRHARSLRRVRPVAGRRRPVSRGGTHRSR